MFEEEAEEYARQNNPAKYGVKATHFTVLNSFKDGAEFGYNKANEWHYVKDGDYPKEKGNYLVAWKRTHHVEEYGEWGFDVDLFNADEGYFEGEGDYVIAWKEIVLPELPKEVDKRKMNFFRKLRNILKKIFKYLIGVCEDCKHCEECAENGFMCGYVGGIHFNFFELKEKGVSNGTI